MIVNESETSPLLRPSPIDEEKGLYINANSRMRCRRSRLVRVVFLFFFTTLPALLLLIFVFQFPLSLNSRLPNRLWEKGQSLLTTGHSSKLDNLDSSLSSSVDTMSTANVDAQAREVLPTNVTPLHYDLQVEPLFEDFSFDGIVKIDLKVNDPATNFVELNTLDIHVKSASLDGSIEPVKIVTNNEAQLTKFIFPDNCFANKKQVQLTIHYKGELNDHMAGFYRAKYTDKVTGETRYMATTQMEPTDARRAFPCFDEPSLKATYDITLVSKDTSLTHLSNMDVKQESIVDGKKVTKFNTTPRMSTYLVAFIVADLRYVECNDFRIPIRVYATPGNEHLGHFAAKLSAKTLQFFENAFGIEYPLPKLDNVAVHEFSAGAMENWGLVTYRMIDLLIDEKQSSLSTLQRVAEVVQHELAHQWFGNLVTMDWWEGLWLNEGFATWMSWHSCNEFQPEWKVWEQYVTDNLQQAMSLDSLRSSHPIEVPVKRADEINQIFDAISYAKGSSLLRMISKWLGEDVFIKGVSNYLNKFKYGNARTEDLWNSLSEASGKDVTSVMNTWTKKIGFPIVTVKEDGNKLTFEQHRYLATADVTPEEDTVLYPVFLSLKTGKNTVDNSLVLEKRTLETTLSDSDFFKVNADQAGVYLTSYSNERWAKFGKQADLLSVEDRTGLVADVATLSSSGYTSTTNFFNLISNWNDEDSFVVWEQILGSLAKLRAAWIFEPAETRDALDAFTRKLVKPKLAQVGYTVDTEKDSYATQRLKVALFGAACSAADPEIEKVALEMFEKYVAGDKSAIPATLKGSVFGTVGRKGGVENYEKLFQIYRNPASTEEKIIALRSLGRFKDAELIERTLSYLLDESVVLNQDIYVPIQGLRSHAAGVEAAWKWLSTNWEAISVRLPAGLSMLGSVVLLSTSGFTQLDKSEEIREFFKERPTKGFDKNLLQSLDMIASKHQWVVRDRDVVAQYLKENGYFN